MILRIFLIVLEVLFITVLDYFMASSYYSLDVLYCLPVIQTARLSALQKQRNNDSHTMTIVAVFCALAWSLAVPDCFEDRKVPGLEEEQE